MSLNESFRRHRTMKKVIGKLEVMGYFPPQPATVKDDDGTDIENPVYREVVDTFIRHFGGFEETVLQAGMEAFVQEWTYRRWPVVGELMPFMKQAQSLVRSEQAKLAGPAPRREQPWDKDKERDYTPPEREEARDRWRAIAEQDRAAGRPVLADGNKLPSECTRAELDVYMAGWPKRQIAEINQRRTA